MPSTYNVVLQGKSYTTPILNRAMDDLANQMTSMKEEIANRTARLNEAIIELNALQKQFLAMYIQETGSFPS